MRSARTLISIQNIYFQRLRASLIIVLDNYYLEVDKYANLIINASNSYDAETNIKGQGYTYNWTCPLQNQNCSRFNQPILNISASDRNRIAGSNNVGSTFVYLV